MSTASEQEFAQRVQRIEGLVQTLEGLAEPAVQAAARELLQAVFELQAAGLGRLLALLRAAGEPGQALLDACGRDELLRHLLALHGLHPVDLETRLRQAFDKVRPLLHACGTEVEVAALDAHRGLLRLRLTGVQGNRIPLLTLKQALEEALLETAPEVTKIEFDGTAPCSGARLALPLIAAPSALAARATAAKEASFQEQRARIRSD